MSESVIVGAHEFWFDMDDRIVHLTFRGPLDAPEVVGLFEFFDRCSRELLPGEAALYLIDNRASTGITSEGRRMIRELSQKMQESSKNVSSFIAICGAPFAVRVVLNLVFKGLELALSGKNNVRFMVEESEAREWLLGYARAVRTREAAS
ncbi:MAG TPA: hypothetical protein VM580_23135 [Labilithrix sp.]|jgi:hypothetical protein|nr:hypothetical protein [Labilithrix sp.]